uniref:Uncharacterized protein n=1 Tax=Lepeophtheirus salmonis TaxID=72036 RepID=A0A0K2VFP5_LEPSM
MYGFCLLYKLQLFLQYFLLIFRKKVDVWPRKACIIKTVCIWETKE